MPRPIMILGVSGLLSPPVNTVLPVITGTPSVGEELTCSQGTWDPAGDTYAYQWKRDGANIGGATASTYTLVDADALTDITCTVTATNAAGSTPATSEPVGPIAPQPVLDKLSSSALGAWSRARLLRNAWLGVTVDSVAGPLIRLIRASDSAQLSFSCTADGVLDTAAIATWIGASSAKIVKVYDQSGNGFHLVQNTDASRETFNASLIGANNRPGGTGPASAVVFALTSAGTGAAFDGLMAGGANIHNVYKSAAGSTQVQVLNKPFEFDVYDNSAPASTLSINIAMSSGNGKWTVALAADTAYVDSFNYDGTSNTTAIDFWRDGAAISDSRTSSGTPPASPNTFDLQWRSDSLKRAETIIFASALSSGDLQTLNTNSNDFYNG